MSRAYKISVSESLRQIVKGKDDVSTRLELLELLPCDQMAAIMTSDLLEQGFQREGEVLVRRQDGVTISIHPESGEVKVSSELSEEVDLQKEEVGYGDADSGRSGRRKAEEQLRKQAREDLQQQADTAADKLTQKATQQLEDVLRDLQGELDGVVNRVTAQALKKKAAQIGEIKSLTEDPESGSMTIVLEV